MTWYMTEEGLVQAPDNDGKNQMLELLKKLELDMDKVATVTFDKSDTGLTLSVQYKQTWPEPF